jgi:hypothetical protein
MAQGGLRKSAETVQIRIMAVIRARLGYAPRVLRLTLRARDDARFLARIIERDGFAFVLDYGDAAMVADASERVARGFSLWRDGKLETVPASSPELLPLLAEFYAQEGLLVALEEPSFTERPEPLEDRLPVSEPNQTITEFREEGEITEEPTELVTLSDVPDLGDVLVPVGGGPKKTNPGAKQPRRMWVPTEGDFAGAPDPTVELADPHEPTLLRENPLLKHKDTATEEEETELVPPDLRARALAMEDGATELYSGSHDIGGIEEDEEGR